MGEAMFKELDAKIDRMSRALDQGGDANAEQLGRDLGGVLWQVGSIVTGAGAAAKGAVKLAEVGINVSKETLAILAAKGPMNAAEVAELGKGVGAGVKGGANGGRIESLAAGDVGFSQNTVSYKNVDRISGERYTYDDLVQSMRVDGWKSEPIDVVKMPDGALTSMDNTRVSAARDAGVNVQANIREFNDPLPAEMIANRRFGDATTWGEALMGRIKNQKPPSFGNINPNGSPNPPKLTGKP